MRRGKTRTLAVIARLTTNEQLTDLLSRLEDAKGEARVSFADGGVYDLRIVSTWHAEAGGDIVADVVRSVQSDCSERLETAAMNFKLDDVVRLESGDECLFTRDDG
ncbi:MAG: hypothetical protein O3C21_11495 [Verrucomicrobia bacterium]|nr:hypothetical protein [Verrucomicrobiota bacterium]